MRQRIEPKKWKIISETAKSITLETRSSINQECPECQSKVASMEQEVAFFNSPKAL